MKSDKSEMKNNLLDENRVYRNKRLCQLFRHLGACVNRSEKGNKEVEENGPVVFGGLCVLLGN